MGVFLEHAVMLVQCSMLIFVNHERLESCDRIRLLQKAVVLLDLFNHEFGQDRSQCRQGADSVDDSHCGVEHRSWVLVRVTHGIFNLVIDHSRADGMGKQDNSVDPHQDAEHNERGLLLGEGTIHTQSREAEDAKGDQIRPHQNHFVCPIPICCKLGGVHCDFNGKAEHHQSDDGNHQIDDE